MKHQKINPKPQATESYEIQLIDLPPKSAPINDIYNEDDYQVDNRQVVSIVYYPSVKIYPKPQPPESPSPLLSTSEISETYITNISLQINSITKQSQLYIEKNYSNM